MPSSTAGGGVGRPTQEGAAAAPLLRLPTAPDKGTGGTEAETQYLEENCVCRCGGRKPTGTRIESGDGSGGGDAVTITVAAGGEEGGACEGGKCCRNRKGKEAKEEASEPTTPGGRVRPVITFSHVEGGGHKGSEGRDNRSRSPSPLLEIPTPVDTSKEIMRPPSAERT